MAIALPPDHDPAVLFKSVAEKLLPASPAAQLQGVWVMTDIKQDGSELELAFDALDSQRVHFAVLGDFEPDVHILVRREEDREFLTGLLGVREGQRYTFSR